MTEILAAAAGLIGIVALLIIAVLFYGTIHAYVACKIWVWLIVPIFHLPELTFAQAWAVALVAAYFQPLQESKSLQGLSTSDKIELALKPVIRAGMILLTAYILKSYI